MARCLLSVGISGRFYLYSFDYPGLSGIGLYDNDNQSKMVDELFAMTNTQLPDSGTQIDDEMEILRSRSTILQVVNELRLHTVYRVRSGFQFIEETALPLVATLDAVAIDTLSATLLMQIEKSSKGYEMTSAQNDVCLTSHFSGFPAFIDTTAGKINLRITNENAKWAGTLKIMISRPIDVVKQCASQLTVGISSKKTSIYRKRPTVILYYLLIRGYRTRN